MQPLEAKPAKEILMSLHGISYVFALLALAAGIMWIYYVMKAVDKNRIGGEDGKGEDGKDDSTTSQVDTVTTMFEGTVAALLLYCVFRHHFHMSHV